MAARVRPAVVMSVGAAETDRALVTLVPHTTSTRGTRFEAAVTVGFLEPGAFGAQNLITIPHAKLLRALGVLRPPQLSAVDDALERWLGFDEVNGRGHRQQKSDDMLYTSVARQTPVVNSPSLLTSSSGRGHETFCPSDTCDAGKGVFQLARIARA